VRGIQRGRADNETVVDFYQHCDYQPFQIADLGKRLIPDE
jgi:hypothetical protein